MIAPATARAGLNQRDERNDSKLVFIDICLSSIHADDGTAAFERYCIAPDAAKTGAPFASAHLAETALEAQCEARMIFG